MDSYFDDNLCPPAITCISGGTGLSTMLRSLKRQTPNITAIVTVTDDGGGSGILRDELGMPPPGNSRSCILALSKRYDEEGAVQLISDTAEINKLGVEVFSAPLAEHDQDLVRHDPNKLAREIMKIYRKKVPTRLYDGRKALLSS